MEVFTGMVAFIGGLVVQDLVNGDKYIVKDTTSVSKESKVIEVEKRIYPTDTSYIVDLKKNPPQVMILKESELKKIMDKKSLNNSKKNVAKKIVTKENKKIKKSEFKEKTIKKDSLNK